MGTVSISILQVLYYRKISWKSIKSNRIGLYLSKVERNIRKWSRYSDKSMTQTVEITSRTMRGVNKVQMKISETILICSCFSRQEEITKMYYICQNVMTLWSIMLKRVAFSKHLDSSSAIARGSNMWQLEREDKLTIE